MQLIYNKHDIDNKDILINFLNSFHYFQYFAGKYEDCPYYKLSLL